MPMTYNLAEFKPMTYDEIVKPLQQATEVLNQYEDALGTLATQASIWEKLANSAQDLKEYLIYKSYLDKITLATDLLLRNGLTPNSRAAVNSLKTSYANLIQPISDAWTLREKQREQEAKEDSLYGRGTILREKSAYDRGLSDYYAGMPLNNAVNLQNIETRVATTATALAKQLKNAYKVGRLDAYTKTLTLLYGFTQNEIEAFMNDPNSREATPILKQIYDSAIELAGIKNWSYLDDNHRASVYSEVDKAIGRGLIHAIGETKMSTFADLGALLAAKAATAASSKKTDKPDILKSPNLVNRFSIRGRTEFEKGLNEYLSYITMDNGVPELTEKGRKELSAPILYRGALSNTGGGTLFNSSPSDFRTWYAKHILKDENKASSQEDFSADAAKNIYEAYLTGGLNYMADANRSSMLEFRVDDSGTQLRLKDLILESKSDKKFSEYDINSDGTMLVPTGDSVNRTDLASNDYKVTGTYESDLGTLAIVRDKLGNTHYIKVNIDTPAISQAMGECYSNIRNEEELYKNSLQMLQDYAEALNREIEAGRITPEEAKAKWDSTQELLMQMLLSDDPQYRNLYVDGNEHTRRLNELWDYVQSLRAQRLRGINPNPEIYGWSSGNSAYPRIHKTERNIYGN